MIKPPASELRPLPYGEGSLAWDPSRGKVTLRHLVNGVRYVERGHTRAEVIAKRDRRRRDLAHRSNLVDAGEGTVAAMLQGWLAFHSSGKSVQSVRSYEWSVGHLAAHLGDIRCPDLTVEDLEQMYEALIAQGMARASLSKLRGHLKMAYDFGVRRRYLVDQGVVRLAKVPEGARRPWVKKWFDLAEYDRVRRHLQVERSPRNALFLTMLLAGLRPGEAMGLRWEHVDLHARTIHVEGTIQRRARGRVGIYSTTLKTDRTGDQAHRAIPMAGDLWAVLAWLQTQAESEWVFSEGGTFLGFNPVDDTAHQIARDAGVRYVNPNGYRHTFASVCRHHGMPYEHLAVLMGHKDATMIVQTYGHPVVALAAVDVDRFTGGAAELG